ncbi:MAG: hypothetical protein V1736_04830 [Pseudomonadota bacterium]
MDIRYWELTYAPYIIDFQIKLLGALSVGDVRTGTIPSLLPSQKHYLKVYSIFQIPEYGGLRNGERKNGRGGDAVTG